jgi:hypothetical protein
MKVLYSDQYGTPAILPEGLTADEVIAACRENGAIFYEDSDECFVVILRPNVGAEIWTENALRKSRSLR